MPAVKQNLYIEQGATFEPPLMTWRAALPDGTPGDPIDLTGWSARMQVRRTQQGAALASLDSAALGGITLGGTAGTIGLKLTATQTNQLTAKAALYDLELESPSGDVVRLMEGTVTVSPNITQLPDEPVVGP